MNPKDITLEWLRDKCVIEEDTGCWLWRGAMSESGQPSACMRTPEDWRKRKTVTVRRLVLELMRERKLRSDLWAYAPCDESRADGEKCICPEHLESRLRNASQIGQTYPLMRRANIAAARRAQSTVDHEAIKRAIAETTLSNVKIAAQAGVHHSLVARIRNGQQVRDYSSPFAGLTP